MATLAPPSPTTPSRRRRKTCLRRCERCCWTTLTFFPLVFVYGISTWAAWVEQWMSYGIESPMAKATCAVAGFALWILLNWSYTAAVFTDPGSPLTTASNNSSSTLPTFKHAYSSVTAKSSGEMRYCKKCQCRKPDRAHHCSTCGRCVLKMDHHCPWLATCVGFRNYKPFLLFLIYTSLFCWLCFAVSASWIYSAIIVSGMVEESLMPINYILLSVLSGIIGLVVGGFTAWHIHLTLKGRTTIESLEQTRYLNPLRQQMSSHLHPERHSAEAENESISDQLRSFGDQIIQTHANALPGVLRTEEGEERASPAQSSLQRAFEWDAAERRRERDRYLDYLDEQANEKLPNAFDLGRRENWCQVMGMNPYLWFLPICNAVGDGWTWRVSDEWREASDRVARRKEEELRRSGLAEPMRHAQAPPLFDPNVPLSISRSPREAYSGAGAVRGEDWEAPQNKSGESTPMMQMDRNGEDEYDTSSDEETLADAKTRLLGQGHGGHVDWNDVPDDMKDRGRKKGRPGSRRT